MESTAELSFRSRGLKITLFCVRLNALRKRIRKARALCVRRKVIPCGPSEYWELSAEGTHWDFYHPDLDDPTPQRVASIPMHEVSWVLGTGPARAEIESYGTKGALRWKIIRKLVQCQRCGIPYEAQWIPLRDAAGPMGIDCLCAGCWEELDENFRDVRPFSEGFRELEKQLRRAETLRAADQGRRANVRWLREFVSEGAYTDAEFAALCDYYGNVCLRCGRKEPLVADHVVPLSRRGQGDISNIQPLCKPCNSIKGNAATDYRPSRCGAQARSHALAAAG